MQAIKAKINSIRPYNNGWAILNCIQGTKQFRATGTLLHEPDSLKGVVCTMEGDWETHPTYGDAFKFTSVTPDGSEMFFFLTRIVKVGEKPAQAMVEKFSDTELTEIMETPARHRELLKVKGVGEARLGKITESWEKYRHVKQLSDFLTPYGLTPNLVMRVYSHFGDNAVTTIRDNPYMLVRVSGLGFKKADDVALRLGTKAHDPFRLSACIEYVMSSYADDDGHTLVDPKTVVDKAKLELDCETGAVDATEIAAELDKKCGRGDLVVLENSVALARHYTTEKKLLERLQSRLLLPPMPILPPAEVETFITAMEREMGIKGFSQEQADAIRLVAAGHRTIAVKGLAGSGKSSLSKALIKMLVKRFSPEQVLCVALSGIASDRIRKTSGFKASTIHTALKWQGKEFTHNAENPLDYKVVVVDESSMIHSSLMRQIIDAVDRDAVLILMGDTGQLPPIGAGDPFRDIIESGLVPVANLTKIFRQSEDSVLTTFAAEIRKGLVPSGYLQPSGFKDFQFVERNLPGNYFRLSDKEKAPLRDKNSAEILAFMEEKLIAIKPYIRDIIGDIQLISPMRKGPLGTEALNALAQRIFNPGEPEGQMIASGAVVFKPGDKVVHTQNKDIRTVQGSTLDDWRQGSSASEAKRVFNGSIGVIIGADTEAKELLVAYPEGFIARYDSLLIATGLLELAFALTVHKLQGSQARFILIPVSSSHAMMLTAQLMYTAITRAVSKALLVGQKFMFERACKSLSDSRRYTVLEHLCQRAN